MPRIQKDIQQHQKLKEHTNPSKAHIKFPGKYIKSRCLNDILNNSRRTRKKNLEKRLENDRKKRAIFLLFSSLSWDVLEFSSYFQSH
jgi:hypothetical protein